MAHARPAVPPDPLNRLVGQSPAIEALRTQIRHLAPFDIIGHPAVPTVLLQGETGTGKGLVARTMHDSGPRAPGPFIDVNCAAIPDTLLEAELFGYEAGAFSDAKRPKVGLFETASGGTLFLDEIDALPVGLQGKLLTAIEAKRVRRLGAVRDHAVDFKLIAATQAGLQAFVQAGRFRADLYHRLAVVVLGLPPLRARGEDILLLARAILQEYAAAHRVRPKRLNLAAEAWLQDYAWPGNVRELRHVLERVTLLHPADLIDPQTLERWCLPVLPTPVVPEMHPAEGEPRDEVARIQEALQRSGGKVVPAARLLGLTRGALRHRLLHYGLGPRGAAVRPRGAPTRPAGVAQPPGEVTATPPHGESPTPPPYEEQKPVVVLAIDLTFPVSMGPEARSYEPWTVARR
jgi:DNA-binding NtrC family response regulator